MPNVDSFDTLEWVRGAEMNQACRGIQATMFRFPMDFIRQQLADRDAAARQSVCEVVRHLDLMPDNGGDDVATAEALWIGLPFVPERKSLEHRRGIRYLTRGFLSPRPVVSARPEVIEKASAFSTEPEIDA